VRSRLLWIAYRLHVHYWGSRSLERWALTGAWSAAIVLVLLGLGHLQADDWATTILPAALLAFLALGLHIYARWAAGQAYMIFEPDDTPPPPQGCAMLPADKILIRATGHFEVEGKLHFFAYLLAYWRTSATREHAVMAIVHRTRFLLLGGVPDRDVGMWYIFWCAEDMVELTPGQAIFGAERRPALRVRYDTPELSSEKRRHLPLWQRRRKFSRRETVWLAFDDEATRQRVWADLVADRR
jgi:hypothetical protein